MPEADVGDVHVNRLLTMASVGYKPEGFIADGIFPSVFVNKQSDIIPFYDQSPWYRDEGQRLIRAPGTPAARTGLSVDVTNTYWAVNNALGALIPDEIRDNEDAPFNMERDVAQLIQGLLMLRRERLFASTHMVTSAWGTDFTVAAKWNDYGLSTPIEDMRNQQRVIRRAIGRKGNLWVWGDLVWQRLQDHPTIIQRLPDNTLRNPTKAHIAAILDIPAGNILVGESMFTSTAEGVAEASVVYSDVWDDDVLCLYVPKRPSLMTPAAGYTFFWRNSIVPRGEQFVRRIVKTEEKAILIEVHTYFHQMKLLETAGQIGLDIVD